MSGKGEEKVEKGERAVQCKRLNFNREKYAFSKLYMWITESKWVVKLPTHN